MATYQLVHTGINNVGQVEYHLSLDSTESVLLHYPTAQSQETLDTECDRLVAEKTAEAEKQAKIDKAIAEALWTDEERANLG